MLENLLVCKWCGIEQPIDEFTFENKAENRRKHYCKACNQKRLQKYYSENRAKLLNQKKQNYRADKPKYLEKSRQYRKSNPDKVKASMATWINNNPDAIKRNNKKRKAVTRGASAKYISVKEIQKLSTAPCFYCGSTEDIQIDHVVPIARGGTHSIGNLISACKNCNSSKNKWFLTEWKKLKKERALWS